MSEPVFHRILLKISGEALMGSQGFGIDPQVTSRVAQEIDEIRRLGVQVAVVVGGGISFEASRPRTMESTAWLRTTWGCWPP